MELDWITVHGFRSLARVTELRLGPINVVIGPNGSGKSNFVGLFDFLRAIREGRLQDYVALAGGADRILHFGSKVTPELYIRVSFRSGMNQYEVGLQPTGTDELLPVREAAFYWDRSKHREPYRDPLLRVGKEAGISDGKAVRIAGYVRQHLDSWRVYHFHDTSAASPLKRTCDLNDNRFLRPDGSNLAAFLYYLRRRHEGSYALVRRTVQQIAPFFDDFVLEPSKLNPDKIRLEWRHKGSDAFFDTSSLSDGTLRFMALACLMLQPVQFRPSVILVDEPELGLHPYAITVLAAMVKQAACDTQVLLSTQSGLLLDNFQPEDVLVAERVEGGTDLVRLDAGRLRGWLEEYSLGQLWEKNELGGRPASE